MPDNIKSKFILTAGVACLLAGCGDKESGMKQFVPPTAAQAKQNQEAQIKNVQDNPNLSPEQKVRIIALYGGADRSPARPTPSMVVPK